MASLSATHSSSEHWLTIMTCTMCEMSPESSPLYRCSMGHIVCAHCFDKLIRSSGELRCGKCNSTRFKQCIVSKDFLQKLKHKPGIGRRRRYRLMDLNRSFLDVSDIVLDEQQKKQSVTLEDLFQLTTNQIYKLFEATSRAKITKLRSEPAIPFERGDTGSKSTTAFVGPKCNAVSVSSRKPLICPHYDCKKLITISTFANHFQHDHSDIPSFTVGRGTTAHLIHDVRMIEFDTTFCLAVIKVAEKSEDDTVIGMFWLLVSGSVEQQKNKSYVLYWLSTNTEEQYKCTIEMSSLKETYSSSTLCAVNKISESYNIGDVAYRLNCLNLCYYSLRNLLQEGCKLHLRVTIH